jgi:hypothetical protein
MIRRIVVGLLSVTFVLAGLAVAQDPPGGDDPPVRLKKKNRPDAAEQPKEEPPKPAEQPKEKDPKAKEPKEGDEPAQPEEPQQDQAEVLNRVGKNMRTSEDRLDHGELTDGTRQVQEDILKDLDSLIDQEKNGGGGGAQDQQDQQNQQNQDQQPNDGQKQSGQKKPGDGKVQVGMGRKKGSLKGSQQPQQAKGGGKKSGQQQQQQQQANGGQGQKPQQGEQQANQGQKPQPGQNAANQSGGGANPPPQGEPNKLADVYKDVWGHLPETMRAQMNAYSREQFMAKYNDLIKQYYSSVAEKSRKKD